MCIRDSNYNYQDGADCDDDDDDDSDDEILLKVGMIVCLRCNRFVTTSKHDTKWWESVQRSNWPCFAQSTADISILQKTNAPIDRSVKCTMQYISSPCPIQSQQIPAFSQMREIVWCISGPTYCVKAIDLAKRNGPSRPIKCEDREATGNWPCLVNGTGYTLELRTSFRVSVFLGHLTDTYLRCLWAPKFGVQVVSLKCKYVHWSLCKIDNVESW